MARIFLEKKNKVEGLTLPDSKTYYKATIIKAECNDRQIDQWNRLQTYKYYSFDSGGTTEQRAMHHPSVNGAALPGHAHSK